MATLDHDLLQVRGEGTRLSSSLDASKSNITRVELHMDPVSTKAGVHTAHRPDCRISCSCRRDIGGNEVHLQRIGFALDEMRDCLDSVVCSVKSTDNVSSLASALASLQSQLNARISCSCQSFATLQSKGPGS